MTIKLPEHHRKQSDENLARINEIKQAEANLLQLIKGDSREGSIARTNIEQGVMWAIRGIGQPKEIQPQKIQNASYSGLTETQLADVRDTPSQNVKVKNASYSGAGPSLGFTPQSISYADLSGGKSQPVLILPRLREGGNEVGITRGCQVLKFSELPAVEGDEFDFYGYSNATDETLRSLNCQNAMKLSVITTDGSLCADETLVKHQYTRTAIYKVPGLTFSFDCLTGRLAILESKYKTFSIGLDMLIDRK